MAYLFQFGGHDDVVCYEWILMPGVENMLKIPAGYILPYSIELATKKLLRRSEVDDETLSSTLRGR